MTPKCFIDMDGVLADFVGGACKVHNRPNPYADPTSAGVWDMEKLWGISAKEFWNPTNNYEFWAGLEKTPEADSIVRLAVDKFGVENTCILTSPSLNEWSVPGKRAWIQKRYPFLAKTMIFAWGKGFLAGPERWLFDDRDRNIVDFKREGGTGILVPRPWNHGWFYPDVMSIIEMQMRGIQPPQPLSISVRPGYGMDALDKLNV